MPVSLLLPRLVRVERAPIRATLCVPEMSLRALALRLLALLTLWPRALARSEPLRIEAALAGLLHPAAALRTLANALADADTPGDVLHANVRPIWLVRVLWRARGRALAERPGGPARRGRGLGEAHEALHSLRTCAIQALVLAILARGQAGAHVLAHRVLMLGVVRLVPAEVVVGVARVLLVLAVQTLAVWTLGLDRAGALHLFGGRAGSRLRSRRTLEDGRVLDKRLRHTVSRVVRRTVVLALRIRWVVVGQRRRVSLLGTLASIWLSLGTRLSRRPGGVLLRTLSVCWRKARCSVRLL